MVDFLGNSCGLLDVMFEINTSSVWQCAKVDALGFLGNTDRFSDATSAKFLKHYNSGRSHMLNCSNVALITLLVLFNILFILESAQLSHFISSLD